ncbi:uncharacterized protein MONBRDRAFT_4816 [Monosiga brevicollis MX1]|uniref:HORMA domain-containing protein n=1 Tax=Monosiga brevicollis TaxID=81824 RepID=A9UP09_MONBE|nr:uncharacterized protein MONBRDRAFT_4816 [Monosiga brevicollis MX1]EDQ92337.1 predicted protein [Monosiga brevicollis MX1]|eukprot:XP_001742099.1 hypothetical protein [Monosiga brevicollis MX1]
MHDQSVCPDLPCNALMYQNTNGWSLHGAGSKLSVWLPCCPPLDDLGTGASVKAIKQLVVMSVSSIAYLRGLFPHSAYGDRNVGEDMAIKVLRANSPCDEAVALVAWLKSLLPGIERHWIDRITLAIHDGYEADDGDELENDTLLETYTVRQKKVSSPALSSKTVIDLWWADCFQIKLGHLNAEAHQALQQSQNASLTLPDYAGFQTDVKSMLRNLLLTTQSLQKLPDVCVVSMRITLAADAPDEAIPAGFITSTSTEGYQIASEHRMRLDVGGVATHHDALKVSVATLRTTGLHATHAPRVDLDLSRNSQTEMPTHSTAQKAQTEANASKKAPQPGGDRKGGAHSALSEATGPQNLESGAAALGFEAPSSTGAPATKRSKTKASRVVSNKANARMPSAANEKMARQQAHSAPLQKGPSPRPLDQFDFDDSQQVWKLLTHPACPLQNQVVRLGLIACGPLRRWRHRLPRNDELRARVDNFEFEAPSKSLCRIVLADIYQ